MIISEYIEVKIVPNVVGFYKEKGYTFEVNEVIKINPIDLKSGSGKTIDVMCDNCGYMKSVKNYNYVKNIEKNGQYECEKCKGDKTKITNIKKYGVIHPMKLKTHKDKMLITMMDKYGVDNISKLDYIKEQRKDNFKTEKFKEKSKITHINKYGVDNISKLDYIKEKKKITTLKNHGVENPSQNTHIFEKAQKSGKTIKLHNGTQLYYRGTYELDFLNYCVENNIFVEKGKRIEYYHNNKKCYYHSDFYLPDYDLICEIKSIYYYKKYLKKNIDKRYYSKQIHNFIFIIDKNYDLLNKNYIFV